jgi:hypothetical protein
MSGVRHCCCQVPHTNLQIQVQTAQLLLFLLLRLPWHGVDMGVPCSQTVKPQVKCCQQLLWLLQAGGRRCATAATWTTCRLCLRLLLLLGVSRYLLAA